MLETDPDNGRTEPGAREQFREMAVTFEENGMPKRTKLLACATRITYFVRMAAVCGLWFVAQSGTVDAAQIAMSGNEEVAVRKVISDFADAWNRHDAKAMAELHTDDVNFVNIFGQWWKGRSEVEEGLRRGHATAFSKSRMLVNTEMVKFLAPNVALVHGAMELQDAPPETMGRCHSSRVLVKENGRWLISSFQNTLTRTGDPAALKK